MQRSWRGLAAIGAVLLLLCAGTAVQAQKRGGILKMYTPDSPASMSIHEEATLFAQGPMMGVFNNLLMSDQHKPQVSMQTLTHDLATDWAWSEDGTALTLHLRQGVKWHDGRPFTAKDVECTWDLLLEKSSEKFRVNPRKSTYKNLDRVTTNGDYEVTFHLKQPQPVFPGFLAGGFTPVYPCHVPPAQMRLHPIGTGPFKFVEYRPNEHIKVAKNPDYWKPGRPYLDAIEWTIIPNRSTQSLAFIAGQFDVTFPYEVTVQMVHDINSQAPNAICEIDPTPVAFNLLVNRDNPPFNDPDIRRAMQLTIDRRAFLDIISEGKGEIS